MPCRCAFCRRFAVSRNSPGDPYIGDDWGPLQGFCRHNIQVIIGIMENNMETTIIYNGLYRDYKDLARILLGNLRL